MWGAPWNTLDFPCVPWDSHIRTSVRRLSGVVENPSGYVVESLFLPSCVENADAHDDCKRRRTRMKLRLTPLGPV